MADAKSVAKTVLITGATDGLGKATAIFLAQRGYRVISAGRSTEKLAQLNALAREQNLPLEPLELDVCSDESVQRGIASALQRGPIDVVVNNAGIGYTAVVEDLKIDDLRRQYETNIFGVLRVTQAVLPHMRLRRSGRILMMSSVAGLVTPPTYGPYSSSKFALEALSNALRLELYHFGIHVVLIEPGYIVTNFQHIAAGLAESYRAAGKSGPYGFIYTAAEEGAKRGRASSKSTPEDCARVILRAIESPNPKARYGVTELATIAKFARRILSDRMGDRILMKRFGIANPPSHVG